MEIISFLSLPRRFAHSSSLPHRARRSRRRLHYRREILLRWQFRHPESSGPNQRWLSLVPYTARMLVSSRSIGELNKLANNVSFGHGILAGIHWRTDTSSSIQLGEAVAISMLQDRAATYAEKFTVNLTKIDGSTGDHSNQ